MLAERIVRQLGEMDDGVVALEIALGHVPQVLRDDRRPGAVVIEEPAVPVVAAVEAGDIVAALQQVGASTAPI